MEVIWFGTTWVNENFILIFFLVKLLFYVFLRKKIKMNVKEDWLCVHCLKRDHNWYMHNYIRIYFQNSKVKRGSIERFFPALKRNVKSGISSFKISLTAWNHVARLRRGNPLPEGVNLNETMRGKCYSGVKQPINSITENRSIQFQLQSSSAVRSCCYPRLTLRDWTEELNWKFKDVYQPEQTLPERPLWQIPEKNKVPPNELHFGLILF